MGQAGAWPVGGRQPGVDASAWAGAEASVWPGAEASVWPGAEASVWPGAEASVWVVGGGRRGGVFARCVLGWWPSGGAYAPPDMGRRSLLYPRREMTPRDGHRSGVVVVLSALMIVIGAALLVEALTGVGSALSARTIIGVLFLAAGAGRLYVERRRGGEGEG